MYLNFHIAETVDGIGVCAHRAQILAPKQPEYYGPFQNGDEAEEFCNVIFEAQTAVLRALDRKAEAARR